MENYVFKPVEEVETQGTFIRAVNFKPVKAPIVCIIIGILLILLRNTVSIVLGLFFIGMSAFVIGLVPDYKVMDLFDKGVEIFDGRDSKDAMFVPYDDIKVWEIKHEDGHDTIEFELVTGQMIIKDTFQADRAYKCLNEYIKEKQEKYIKAQEHKHISLGDSLRNIMKKRNNKKND